MSFHHNWFNFNEYGPSQQQKHKDLIISFYCHTLCQRHSWALEESHCACRDQIHCITTWFQARLALSTVSKLIWGIPILLHSTILSFVPFQRIVPTRNLPACLIENELCPCSKFFYEPLLCFTSLPAAGVPIPLLLLSCPMNLHSCLWTDVILITPCRVMLIHIINVLKCTLV